MSPERVGRIPQIAAIGMNLLIITLRRHAISLSLAVERHAQNVLLWSARRFFIWASKAHALSYRHTQNVPLIAHFFFFWISLNYVQTHTKSVVDLYWKMLSVFGIGRSTNFFRDQFTSGEFRRSDFDCKRLQRIHSQNFENLRKRTPEFTNILV